MALSTVVKNLNDGTIIVKDATGTPITVTVQFSNGDFSISGLRKKLKDVNAYQTRGTLNSVRHTTRYFPTFSFTAQMSQFTNATAYLADAIMKAGAFASGVSTLGAASDIWAVTIVFTSEGTDFSDSADHTFTLTSCDCQLDFAEGDPNSFTISGTVYGAITGDLAAS